MSKYIFIVGGVMSGVGKGTSSASIGKILQSKGFEVTAIKIDPYINVDAGTMNPIEHGEVFVTDDGDETDQDIGTYERFLGATISSVNYMTTGRVYQTVIERERNLEYGGKCVEVVPHVPDEVIRRIRLAAKRAKADITLIEVGGTVGEYQNILFLEAARMMKLAAPQDVLFVLVSYLPVPGNLGEMKTKPTQYASHTLNSAGIQADIIIARAERSIDEPRRKKLALFCGVDPKDIIAAPDIDSVYKVPLNFEKQHLADIIMKKFNMKSRRRKDMRDWKKIVRVAESALKTVRIGVIGKYFSTGDFTLSDVYLSVIEALKHAAWFHKTRSELLWLNSEAYEKDHALLKELDNLDGVVIPGGFGSRGVEGKIKAIQYARTRKIPYLGLCYGMQLAVVEFARHVCGMKEANTAEIKPDVITPVIHIMPDQQKNVATQKYGGTMRLGAYPCLLHPKSKSRVAYGARVISERHRHRYEVNNKYRPLFEKKGLLIAGTSPDKKLVEIIEIPDHPFFVGTQFHPEFKSRPLNPHPLFREFIAAAIRKR
ncbi:MAG: CTP synthetase [Parcubacteria group bacterium GW2011_GWA2_47_26]|nr:MAG: CTP synthetase [Parcubacteria group bacterium GW2011_GWA2_47_26]